MNARRLVVAVELAGALALAQARTAPAQCCLNDFFAGFHSCFAKAPQAYAVAPVAAPVMAPVMAPAPVPAPPPPVMVPVQQVSYVPETTYRTEYRSVPVTSYKPSCEIDPCTGCPRDCMEQVTNYVQQPVNVPVTQYRAVYSTKYVQMQPQQGYAQPVYGQAPAGVVPAAAPTAGSAWVPGATVAPGPAGAVASPFAAPAAAATAPSAWGAAGADIPQQVLPGQTSIAAPALQPGSVAPSSPQIVPQSGTFAVPPSQGTSLQPTAPPTLTPAPSLRPIPETPKTFAPQGSTTPGAATSGSAGTGGFPGTSGFPATQSGTPASGGAATAAPGGVGTTPDTSGNLDAARSAVPSTSTPGASPTAGAAVGTAPRLVPIPMLPASPQTPAPRGPAGGMPTVPGPGPGTTTGAFPRLLAPTAHTTSWQPVVTGSPTAALPTPARQ